MSAGTVEDVRTARRMLCFGVTGSGKSTLAGELAAARGLPLHLVDDLCWEPGWIQSSIEVQDARIEPVLRSAEYVIDSVYGRHNALALANVDAVVALDYPRHISLGRLIRRTVRRIRKRDLVCNGNVETVARALGRDSILLWHFRSFRSKRERLQAWAGDPAMPPVVVLRHPRETEQLLRTLRTARPTLNASERKRCHWAMPLLHGRRWRRPRS